MWMPYYKNVHAEEETGVTQSGCKDIHEIWNLWSKKLSTAFIITFQIKYRLMPHILKNPTQLAQDNVWHCLNIVSGICHWNMLVPIGKTVLETKPGRVGFLSTSPPSSSDDFAKALIFTQLSSSVFANTWQFIFCLSWSHVSDATGSSEFPQTCWCVHKT